MNKFTVEETNLLSIYQTESKRETMKNISAALPFMAEDIQGIAKRLMKKIEDLTEAEYAEFTVYPADEAE
ncbi:MAG: conjugal transfer protein [Ruminococcaceae bacterium]|nr:conjugal transfer protein [Oscillospiraceae bacterium]